MAAKKKSNKPSISKEPPINYNAKWADAIATVRKADEAKSAMQAQGTKNLKAYQQAKIAESSDKMLRATKIQDTGKAGVSYTTRESGSSIMRNLFRFGSGGLKNSGR
jgi:hypothetical protein